ncbi:hypothetical protein JCM6882_001237 [Rhodosporidiobolus microsporus]
MSDHPHAVAWQEKLRDIGFVDTLVALVQAFEETYIRPAEGTASYSTVLVNHHSLRVLHGGDGLTPESPLYLAAPSFDVLLASVLETTAPGARQLLALPPLGMTREQLAQRGFYTTHGPAPEWYSRFVPDPRYSGTFVIKRPNLRVPFVQHSERFHATLTLQQHPEEPYPLTYPPRQGVTHDLQYTYTSGGRPQHLFASIMFAMDPYKVRGPEGGLVPQVLNPAGGGRR